MADSKPIASGGTLRVVYYLLAAVSVFFIFLLAVTSSVDRFDTEIILTMIIAVLLLAFMLHTSSMLAAIRKQLEAIEQRTGK